MFSHKVSSFLAVVCLGSFGVFADKPKGMPPDVLECIKEFGISVEKAMEIQKSGNPDGVDPCVFSCILKKNGVIDSKGMYDLNAALELNREHIKNDQLLAKLDSIKKNCVKVNEEKVSDGDMGCERAVKLFVCLSEQQQEFTFQNKED